jgi:hypothetical protein
MKSLHQSRQRRSIYLGVVPVGEKYREMKGLYFDPQWKAAVACGRGEWPVPIPFASLGGPDFAETAGSLSCAWWRIAGLSPGSKAPPLPARRILGKENPSDYEWVQFDVNKACPGTYSVNAT